MVKQVASGVTETFRKSLIRRILDRFLNFLTTFRFVTFLPKNSLTNESK